MFGLFGGVVVVQGFVSKIYSDNFKSVCTCCCHRGNIFTLSESSSPYQLKSVLKVLPNFLMECASSIAMAAKLSVRCLKLQ